MPNKFITSLLFFLSLTHLVQAEVDFRKDIKPVFQETCWKCHGADKQEAGLRLDQKDAALTGGDSGIAIIPGNPEESLLMKLVSGADADRPMPPKGEALTKEQLKKLSMWISEGANWPE